MTTKRKVQQKLQQEAIDPAIELARAEKAKRAKSKKPKLDTESVKATMKAPKTTSKPAKEPKAEVAPKPPRPKITAYSITKSGKMSARGLTCLCGCGSPTMTSDARFLPGHDAKLRQSLLNGGDIPEIIRPFFDNGETIAGLWLNEEGELEDVKSSAADAA